MFDHVVDYDLDLRSILIARNGYMVVEAYFYPHRQRMTQSVSSCTNSFTSALVGIAIDAGFIDGTGERLLSFFPDREIANADPRKEEVTLEHLSTLTSGVDRPESSVSYESADSILGQVLRSHDYTQFVLDRPMAADPGSTYNYSTGDSNLLGAVIEVATGMSPHQYARGRLFPAAAQERRSVGEP